ncbi:hypothetical protein C0991_003886 [Blastosporella zonata]|nr:hypothetical protein C0991_003886 [Blastosporella zonata]
MSTWFSSWLPALPSLNIPLTSSLQGRFISFVLKKSLGHFLRPGQLDSRQIDSKIGSGFVQINDLELDNEAINSLISDLPVSLQAGSISSVIARIPWPNPLSSTLGFSLDSLHLTFHLLPAISDSAHPSSNLAESVASVAESFIHDELSPQEGAALWTSFHSDIVTPEQLGGDPIVPGGLSADPFLSNPEEAATQSDLDPAGVSIFATLIERLLARFEFDATNTKVTIVHPKNMSITASISEIRYHTDDNNGVSGLTPDTVQLRGQRRTLSISGLTFSAQNLRSDTQIPGLFTPTRYSPPASSSRDSPRPVSPSSSSSSMDEDTQFAMSQSLAFLPPRQPSPSGSVSSSMYQSAISTVSMHTDGGNDDHLDRSGSRTPSPVTRPATLPAIPLPSHNQVYEHATGDIMMSFGSAPILLHINTPPPASFEADNFSVHGNEPGGEQGVQFTLTLGVIACALQAWQIRALLELANEFQSHPQAGKDTQTQSMIDFKLVANIRGLVILVPLPSSKSSDAPSLAEFFKWPLVPLILPHSYARLYLETISISISSKPALHVSSGNKEKATSSTVKATTGALTVDDISLFYIHESSSVIPARDLVASPILITDPDLPSLYDFHHQHPSKDGPDLLPTFEIVDWTADKHLSNGLKLSLWRTKPAPRRNAVHPGTNVVPPVRSAVAIKIRYRISSPRSEQQETSDEVEVNIIPLHIFLDLGRIRWDEIFSFMDEVLGDKQPIDRLSAQEPEALSSSDDSDGEENTPPPTSHRIWHTEEGESERRRLAKLVLEDLDLDHNYGVKDGTRVQKSTRQRSTKANGKDGSTSIVFDMIRVQIRCPSPSRSHPRSGALMIDLRDIRLSTSPVQAKNSTRFTADIPRPRERPVSNESFILGAEFERIVVAYCPARETSGRSILSIGSLSSSLDDTFNPVAPSLLPRVTVAKSSPVAIERSEVVAISLNVPSVVVDISKPILDGLQYWADDVTQHMDQFPSEDQLTEKADSRDTSLIGSRYFAKSRSGSGSAWSASSGGPRSEMVVKMNVSEASIRAMVPRAQTLDERPFIVFASDIDILVEPKPEGKDEMVLTVGVMDVTIKDVVSATSSRTYLALTSPRSLISAPKSMVKLRFTSLVLPETTSKESRVRLTLSGFTFTCYPDLAWIKDLATFAQSPPGTFEAVIPSERTRITLKLFDGAIQVFAPIHPGAIVVHIDDLDFATDVVGNSSDSSFRITIPALAILAIDDVSYEANPDTATLRYGITLWKAFGFALIAEVEDLSMAVLHINEGPSTNVGGIVMQTRTGIHSSHTQILIDRVVFKMHIAADSLGAVTTFVDDVGTIFRISEEERHPNRGPPLLSKAHSERSVMASIDDLAFKKIPEVGPAPDMISDDLPTNMDYLDESFGAAAGLRELRDDDLDEFDNEESPPEYSGTTADGTGVVSRVGGETIKMIRPEGISLTENYFDSLPPQDIHEEIGETTFQLRVKNGDITLFLYDGYDWSKTRKTIEEEVKEMRRRLAKIRQLVANGQVQDPSAEDTGALLYNSIYIGLDHDVDGLEPGAIIAAIDEELKEDIETATQSSWQSLKPPASGKPQTQSLRVHGKRLTRSRGPSMEFRLVGLDATVDNYLPNATMLSRTLVKVRDLEILDHIKTSTWKKFLTELRADSRGNVRETDSNMVRIELLSVRPVPDLPAKEARLRAKILPLRLYVDQDAVDFLKSFFSFKDPHASATANSSSEEIYFQLAEVFPIDLKLDYKPRRVDYRALREGRTIELMNFFHFDGAEMTLRHITLAGITGWARLGDLLNDLWTPDVKATQLVEVISGVAPIRSVVNVGSGVADLVLLPIAQYKKDGRIVRGVQKGTTAFVKSTAIEAIKLGARLATGTQVILEQTEGVLGGQFTHPITMETVTGGTGDDFMYLEDDPNEDPADIISKYAQQPVDIKEGVQSAYKSLRRNLNSAAQTILAVPMEVYERSGNEGPVRAVIRAVPIAVLKPMIGASEALSKTLLGLHNSLDPDVRHENEAKYKRR